MKKLYSALLVALVALFPLSLSAKTVTFTADNPKEVTLFNTDTYAYINFGESNTLELTLGENAGINVTVSSGYELAGISVNGTALTLSGTSSHYINYGDMPDGCTVSITTKEKEAAVIYVVADPTQVSLTENYSNVYNADNSVDGKWTVPVTNEYGYLAINCAEGYVLLSVKDDKGADLIPSYQLYKSSVSLYLGSMSTGTTIVIECGKLAELRNVHVSVVIEDGTASEVTIRRNSESEPVPASEYSDIALYPAADLPLSISAASYGKSLYKVLVNGEAQTPQGSTFVLNTLADGDVITVYPNFPEVNVPVSLKFTNEGTEGAVSSVYVNGDLVAATQWQADDFTVAMGSNLSINYNTNDYTISSVTLNGEYSSPYGYSATVTTETPLNFVITAEKVRDWEVKLYYEPGTVKVWLGTGDYGTPVELPEGSDEYTVTVSPSNAYLYFKAADGYVLTSIINEATQEDLKSRNPVSVSGDMTLFVYTEKFERDQNCVVYLEEKPWNYAVLTLSTTNYDNRKEIYLEEGYNFVEYADSDRPFGLSLYTPSYGNGVVYLNGTKIENNYGVYPALENMEPNSVIKIFYPDTEVSNYALTVNVAENADVNLLADYITLIDSEQATVLGPTDVLIENNTESIIEVKLNGVDLVPNDKGALVAHITADSTIDVALKQDGILEIDADKAGEDVIYNLQGIRVQKPGHGLYIVNGKKVKL